MMPSTISLYFGRRFLFVVAATFGGFSALTVMIDFIELLRRTSEVKDASTLLKLQISFFRMMYLTEQIIPFTVLIGAMVCYVNLSRRLELVVVRSAGMSAWQFVTPAVVLAAILGIIVTTIYNPASTYFRERSEQLEATLFGNARNPLTIASGFWMRQRSQDGQSIINASSSRQQGTELSGVSIFMLDNSDHYLARIEAARATLHDGYWLLGDARIYTGEAPPTSHATYELKTNLSRAQVQESFATPETVPFWQLSSLINLAESSGLAAVAYRLQYYQLLMLPMYLVSMVLLAAAVSLRMFRFGGVQKMMLGGITAGFSLYVLTKITADLTKASLLAPAVAAALPSFLGGLTGLIALLYQEDG